MTFLATASTSRLAFENECEPGGVYLSGSAFEQLRGKTKFFFEDLGERELKNIDRPVRLFAVRSAVDSRTENSYREPAIPADPPLPDKPSIAVLPFTNMSDDPEQEYFADGMAEDNHHFLVAVEVLVRNRAELVIYV